jgi:predicted RecA/RadA family phage recombinase
MQNYVKPGNIMTFTAPTGGVVSGTAYLIGSLLVVAQASAAEGAEFEGVVEGVVTLPKTDEQAWTEGQKIYWDAGNACCTNVATAGQLVGVAAAAVASTQGLVTGQVRLNGAAPATAEGPQATIAALTMDAGIATATANGALVGSAGATPSQAEFNELAKEFAVKTNEIITALKAAGIVAAS